MDEELIAYLDRKFEAVDRRLDGIDERFVSMKEQLVALIASEVGSLHNEIEGVRAGIARLEERLDRQGVILAGGIKAVGTLCRAC